MDELERQRQFEDQFVSQLRGRATALARGQLPADRVDVEPVSDGVDGARATLTRLERFDRELLYRLPGAKAVQLRFTRRALGGLLRNTVARVRAQVLAPLEDLVAQRPPQPVSRDQVLDALARYELMPRAQRPTGAVFASATGFSPAARDLVRTHGPPTLILLGRRQDGGWDVDMPDALARTPWARLFELESADEQAQRLLRHVEQSADLMDSRGLSLDELAQQLGLDRARVEALVRRAAREDARLMTIVIDGQTRLCRSPLSEEGNRMSIMSRIRKWLRMKPTPAERVRMLTEQRVRLEAQRFELDSKAAALEAQEVETVKAGAAATTTVEKKQLAGKLIRLRRELGRHKTQAEMLTRQIDILGTHVHHLTLKERGRRMELPSAEELTREAAQAEKIVAELGANAELARGIEVTGQGLASSDEEDAILAEFEAAGAAARSAAGAAPQEAPTAADAPSAGPAAPESSRRPAADSRASREPPRPPAVPQGEKARPEVG